MWDIPTYIYILMGNSFSFLSYFIYRSSYPTPKDFGQGGYCSGIVHPSLRPTSFLLSVLLFFPDPYLGNGFSDCIVILQEYEHAFEDGSHQV